MDFRMMLEGAWHRISGSNRGIQKRQEGCN